VNSAASTFSNVPPRLLLALVVTSWLSRLVRRIEVRSDRIDLQLLPSRLAAFLRDDRQETGAAIVTGEEEVVTLSVPAHLRRAGLGMAMIIDGSVGHGRAAKPDPKLVKLIARAHRFQEKLIRSGAHLSDVARDEKLTGSYFTRVVRLSDLAPDITRAILEGRHPRDLTAEKLLDHSRLPLGWPEQHHLLGFASAGSAALKRVNGFTAGARGIMTA
jgi:site-specific DNA recombinase